MIGGILLVITGLAVLVGYRYDCMILVQIRPDWVAMQPFTAAAFICSGVLICTIRRALIHQGAKWEIICSTSAVSLVMLLFWESIRFIIEGSPIFAGADPGAARFEDLLPRMPSVGTIISFAMIAACGMFAVWNTRRATPRILKMAGLVGVISLVALVGGYGMNVPALRFYNPTYSTGMAFHTAALFLVASLALMWSAWRVAHDRDIPVIS